MDRLDKMSTNRQELTKGAAGRTCANCACSMVLEPPRVQPPGVTKAQFDAMPKKAQRVCRWFPPQLIVGVGIMQQPVEDHLTCWQWQKEGTLPGDRSGTHAQSHGG